MPVTRKQDAKGRGDIRAWLGSLPAIKPQRGRPKKKPLLDGEEAANRGRPRKKPLLDGEEAANRGRPKKKPLLNGEEAANSGGDHSKKRNWFFYITGIMRK